MPKRAKEFLNKMDAFLVDREKSVFTCTYVLSIFMLASLAVVAVISPQAYIDLNTEDNLIENLQVLVLILAGVVGMRTFGDLQKQRKWPLAILVLSFSLVMILFALEEISFGQRLLGLETPEAWANRNRQRELNFHNLKGINEKIYKLQFLIGIIALFSWWGRRVLEKKPWSFFAAILPEARTIFFFVVAGAYAGYRITPGVRASDKVLGLDIQVWRYQEPVELLLYSGFFLVAVSNFVMVRKWLKLDRK